MSGCNGPDLKHMMELHADRAMREARKAGVPMGDEEMDKYPSTDPQQHYYQEKAKYEAAKMQQAQMNALMQHQGFQQGLGQALGMQGWATAGGSATQAQIDPRAYMKAPEIEDYGRSKKKPSINRIKFMRLHKEVCMDEGATFEEPLDKLRLTVARWLERSGERMPSFAL